MGIAMLVALTLVAGGVRSAAAQTQTGKVGSVTVSTPPHVGVAESAAPLGIVDLAKAGYVEQEFLLSGVATRYRNSGNWTSDGVWTVTPAGQEPYTSRILVRRPTEGRRFNGVVVVEWFNVSRGYDAEATFPQLWPLLLREGYAWVGVSAQKIGLDALKVSKVYPPARIALGDPVRYAAIASAKTDGFSYDIFSQAGNAVRTQAGVLLGGLRPDRLLGTGTSQSAGRLVTHVNAIHPLARVFDGFLIHARGAGGAALDNVPGAETAIDVPSPSYIRADLNVPVFTVNSETDATGYFSARQPDSTRFRYWEVAGSSHAPRFRNIFQNVQVGLPIDSEPCELPANNMPLHRVLQAALSHLNTWVAKGTLPPSLPKLTIEGTPPNIKRDQYGNALGGVRLPEMNVPSARYAPRAVTSSSDPVLRLVCPLSGSVNYWSNTAAPATPPADPWPEPSLKSLYRSHDAYVTKFTQAARDAVAAGYLLELNAKESIDQAVQSEVAK
jgi:hypothetical protein